MANYLNPNDNSMFWDPQNPQYSPNQSYYTSDYAQFQNEQLDFQPFSEYGPQTANQNFSQSQIYDPMSYTKTADDDQVDEEPALLEELEIYPDRILQKMLAVLNPFRQHGLTDDAEYLTKDPDLAGPITFYLVLAVCLFVSGNKAHFGYIYGVSVLSCILMYCLLTLMTSESGVFNLTTVASILGYSLIPIIALSVLGIFVSLKGPFGIVLAILAVLWSSASASRLFVAISGDKEQQPLTAYPCALVSGVYALLVIF